MNNYKHTRCYASSLGGCSRKISGEHYISKGVLEQIGKKLELSGTPWLKGKSKLIPVTGLIANMLCTNHNNQLSNVDNVAIKLLETLRRYHNEINSTNTNITDEIIYFSGKQIERWFVKVYIGMHWAGNFGANGIKSPLDKIEQYLLDCLFLDMALPSDYGLYNVHLPLNHKIQVSNSLSIITHHSTVTNSIVSMTFEFIGIPFLMSLRAAHSNGTGKIDNHVRHPHGLSLRNDKVTKELVYEW